jgi:Bacterial extracellular solute-binding protein/von Willebrand factor type A domain
MARRAQSTAQGSSQQGTPTSGSSARGPAARSRGPAGGPGGPAAARRKARFSTGALVAIAVVFSLVLLIGLSVQAVAAHASCGSSPLLLNVAVNDDLAPAVAQVAQDFNKQQHTAGGRCVTVQVTEQSAATVAARLDGQGSGAGQAAVQAWIPDSSLWVDVARSYPKGAQAIQPTGTEVAESPLMTVMARTVANQTGAFASPAGWNVLLPAAAGGPPASLGLKVAIPDPKESAAGLATLVELSRLLGSGATARATFTNFVLSAESTQQFASPTSLASFVSTSAAPWHSRDVTVTSEQAVIAYDRDNPTQTLAAQYPTGLQAKLGTATLDYPFVLTTSDSAEQDAARQFEQSLRQPYAASVIRYAGFRTANGVADATPASFGLQTQVLQEAAAASASEAQTNLEVWGKLELGSRLLVMIDTSESMGISDGVGRQTLADETGQTSTIGLSLFPDSTQIGLWEIADNLTGSQPYQQLVPIGPLPAELGLISRRQQLQQIDEALRPDGKPLQLNNAILAGYRAMTAAYRPHYSNALIVLTAGVDNAPGDMSTAALMAQVRKLFNPQRPVQILIDQIGTAGNFAPLQSIAALTGGAAYEVHRPAEIGKVFIESFSHRLCTPSCAATP